MLRISLDSPALVAVRSLLGGVTGRPTPRAGRYGRRKASRTRFSGERLEPRTMLDAHMRALLPDLVAASDTGASNSDNLTSDRTPVLTGSVRGPVSQVRLFINGRRGDLLPVTNGTWTHEVPATAALSAGKHTVAVRPVDSSGRVGPLSRPLHVTVMAAAPTA
ncbi:MAG: Ig-like domain-containing protein, partial [Planctomycetota bacterium]